MGGFVRKLFNLYPGEERNAVFFSILAYIWAFGAYCGVTLSDGMYLEQVGADKLPLAYLLTALSLFFISVIFIYAFNHFDAFRIYVSTLLFGCLGFVVTLIYLPGKTSENFAFWLWFKVFCNILMVILTTSYWFFLDQYFNLQNAKRLYSLFNSSIFLGNACGGAFLAVTLNLIGMKGISIAIIGLFITAGLWLFFLTKRIKPFLDDSIEGLATPEKLPFKAMIKGFLSSKFTLLLMIFYFLIQLINVVCEFTYMQSFDAFFDSPKDGVNDNSLTVFLGTCTSLIALGNMFFGLFFYSRIVGRFGINNIVGISPVFFLFTFSSWQFSDALLIAIFGLIVVEGISYTLDENNSNLLLNTVPTKLKNKARVAIDSFFEPLGMFLSALIFLLFSVPSKEVGLYLTLFSLIFVLLIRTQYSRAVLKNLLQNAIHFERKSRDWFLSLSKKELLLTKAHLLKFFKQREENDRLFAFEMLLNLDDSKLLARLLGQASLLSVKGKIKIIQLLSDSQFAKDTQVLLWLSSQLQKGWQSSLKGHIYFYFARFGLLQFSKVKDDINNPDLHLRAASLIAFYSIDEEEAIKNITKMLQSSQIDEICIGLTILSVIKNTIFQDLIIPFLEHTNPKIALSASIAFYQIAAKECVPYAKQILELIKSSKDSNFKINCLKALGKMEDPHLASSIILSSLHLRPNEKRVVEEVIINLGVKTIPILLEIANDKKISDKYRLLAGKTLGLLSIKDLKENLKDIVSSEIERAYFYYFYSVELPEEYNNYSLKLLKETLYSDHQNCIDFIIQLLGVSGSIENSELLSHGLHSKNPKLRATAIETLEKTCESPIFHLLKPLIDDRPQIEKIRIYKKRKLRQVSLPELLEILENTPTQTHLAITVTMKEAIKI